MRFSMIFEGVDRATKVMQKIMSAEKAAASASVSNSKKTEAAASAVVNTMGKQAAAANKSSSAFRSLGTAARSGFSSVRSGADAAFRAVANGAKAAGRAVAALHRQTVQLAKSGLGQIAEGGQKAFRGLALAGTVGAAAAITSFGAAAGAATSMLDVASQFEQFQTILETTEGSSAKARTAMSWVVDFAAKTPYELAEVNEAFVQLRTRGLDPTNGLLKTLGDTSAAMGQPIMQAVEAMADAVTGENERLKAFGIVASKTGNKITYEYTNAAGKTVTASVKAGDRLAIQAKLMQIWSEKYGGAMEKLSATWSGMVSNLADLWAQFQLAIMDAGLFDWMKDKLQMMLDTLNQMKADGTFDAWAKRISGNILHVLESAWSFAVSLWSVFEKLRTYLTAAADYVGGWENLAAILAGMVFAPALVSTAAGLVQIAMGLSMLSAALMANPIVLIIAAIVAGAVAIYVYWEPIKAFFIGLWSSISEGASAAWGAVKEWLGFDPMAVMSSAWSSVSGVVSDAWAAIPALTWDNVLTALDWISWISPLRWLDFIPGFSWSGVISGALDWGTYLVSLDWTEYLPEFSWPELPSFDWPELPALQLPEMPDIAGWIGGVGDKAMAAIDAVSARLSSAWSSVKSAFSFGGEDAEVTVTDPATIQAAAAATAALKADMQAVAAIDTTAALERLRAVEAATAAIFPAVTGAIQQAVTFLGGVSFFNQGASLMDTMAAGIRARSAAAVAEIAKVAQAMRDHLPSSPAKVGPLSDIHRLKFGETIAESIRAAPMVNAMRAAAAATMSAAAITAPVIPAPALALSDAVSAQSQSEAARSQIAQMSVQSSPQQTGAAPVTLHFSPTLKMPAGGQSGDLKAEFDKMMRDSARQLADLLDEEQRRRARRNV